MAKPRITETHEGIQAEADTIAYDKMMCKLRDRNEGGNLSKTKHRKHRFSVSVLFITYNK